MADNRSDERAKRYEKALEILLDDSLFQKKIRGEDKINTLHTTKTKTVNGETETIMTTSLGEYTVVDEGKDLDELDKDEYSAIKQQNKVRKYKKISRFGKKGSLLYGVSCTFGKLASLFLI